MSRYLATVAAMAIVTILTRAAPFLFFSKRRPPAALDYLQAYLPPALMTILVLSSFRSIQWSASPFGIPAIAGVAVTALMHLWRRNVLLSIACGTGTYMALIRLIA